MGRSYDDNGIRKLEAIIDQTFADLGIPADSAYAKAARQRIAELLLSTQFDDWPVSLAARLLTHKARQSRVISNYSGASAGVLASNPGAQSGGSADTTPHGRGQTR